MYPHTKTSDFDPNESTFQTHYSSSPPHSPESTNHSSPTTSSSNTSSSSSSSPILLPNPQQTFAPPFYNRPPTPLPPSPSLTSLLRPSRPTTPDSSPDELCTTLSSRPLPRASPKVPTYEYYGFVLYLFSSLTFLLYILWSYLPSPFLHALGVHYYPNRWWSLALPAWLVVAVGWVYVALAGYNTGYLTLSLESVEGIVDRAGSVAILADGEGAKERKGRRSQKHRDRERERERGESRGGKHGSLGTGGAGKNGREWKKIWSRGTDAVMDVPLGGVCEVLYGEGGEESED